MATTVAVGQTVYFTDQSTNTDSSVTYQWDFGGIEGTSTLQNPTHIYNTPGTYNITHSVKNSCNTSPIVCTTQQIVVVPQICMWIMNNGGIHPMPINNVSSLKSAYLNITPLGFPVSISHISGVKSYYLGIISSGNSLTGCNLT